MAEKFVGFELLKSAFCFDKALIINMLAEK